MKVEDLIETLENDEAIDTRFILLSMAYALKEMQDDMERMDNDIRNYDP